MATLTKTITLPNGLTRSIPADYKVEFLAHVSLGRRGYWSMPEGYEADEITDEDLVHDCNLRIILPSN